MANDETQSPRVAADEDTTMAPVPAAPPTAPAAMAAGNRKRPRLNLTVEAGKDADAAQGRERKRGKSMFGLLLGTLNKAKVEDSERSKSDAAKKRQLTEQRLQDRLRKETDSVRRAEEVKKDKTNANRKEEDLQLKDSIHKLRRTRLPLLANFLSTADHIPPLPSSDDAAPSSSRNPLAALPKSHPPPLYYLPVILTSAQEAFLLKRKSGVTQAAEAEWQTFREERTAGIDEILKLRERVLEEDARKKGEQVLKDSQHTLNGDEVKMEEEATKGKKDEGDPQSGDKAESLKKEEAVMDVDDEAKPAPSPSSEPSSAALAHERLANTETKVAPAVPLAKPEVMQTDEDDAVEY